MHPIISHTFGGLTKACYIRHFFFGLLITAIFIIFMIDGYEEGKFPLGMSIWLVISTFLYPYARFVYEGIAGFILGENVFILPAFIMLSSKLLTMILCFGFAIFIAPIGLAYLYYRNSKAVD